MTIVSDMNKKIIYAISTLLYAGTDIEDISFNLEDTALMAVKTEVAKWRENLRSGAHPDTFYYSGIKISTNAETGRITAEDFSAGTLFIAPIEDGSGLSEFRGRPKEGVAIIQKGGVMTAPEIMRSEHIGYPLLYKGEVAQCDELLTYKEAKRSRRIYCGLTTAATAFTTSQSLSEVAKSETVAVLRMYAGMLFDEQMLISEGQFCKTTSAEMYNTVLERTKKEEFKKAINKNIDELTKNNFRDLPCGDGESAIYYVTNIVEGFQSFVNENKERILRECVEGLKKKGLISEQYNLSELKDPVKEVFNHSRIIHNPEFFFGDSDDQRVANIACFHGCSLINPSGGFHIDFPFWEKDIPEVFIAQAIKNYVFDNKEISYMIIH